MPGFTTVARYNRASARREGRYLLSIADNVNLPVALVEDALFDTPPSSPTTSENTPLLSTTRIDSVQAERGSNNGFGSIAKDPETLIEIRPVQCIPLSRLLTNTALFVAALAIIWMTVAAVLCTFCILDVGFDGELLRLALLWVALPLGGAMDLIFAVCVYILVSDGSVYREALIEAFLGMMRAIAGVGGVILSVAIMGATMDWARGQ